ncbi:MAG TPA: alpha/beta hydrolase fold domain-containing protein [Opitutaceae bacterium]|nr:alpha/beta hydrolase fold domain-containing protein [Opitutaceae bacterium]
MSRVKYRLIPTPASLDEFRDGMSHNFAPPAKAGAAAGEAHPRMPNWDLTNQLQDAEAAYALILKRAAEWHVDPARLGMVGFSAGAGLTMESALHSKTMKLAFIAPIYGSLRAVEVPKDAPPLFFVVASDDPLMFHGDFGLIKSWWDAKRPVEFHLYQNGGHGFGLGYPNRTANGWFPVFIHWLEVNKFLGKSSAHP